MKILTIKNCRECPYQYWHDTKLEPICNLINLNVLSGQGIPIDDCPLKDITEFKKQVSNFIEDLICCGGDWEKTVDDIINLVERATL